MTTPTSPGFLDTSAGTLTLPALVDRAANAWPEDIALQFDASGTVLTFADLATKVRAAACGLEHALGVGRGGHVALMLGNVPEFPIAWLAIATLGGVAVPVNAHLRQSDLEAVLTRTELRAVVTEEIHREAVAAVSPAVPVVTIDGTEIDALSWPSILELAAFPRPDHARATVRPEDVANVQFTSGSTGQSKGCVLTHAYWVEIARTMATSGPRLSRDDVLLTAQPFYYMDPMWNLATALALGCRLVVADRFHPRTFWGMVRRHRVTYFYCLGVMPAMLLLTDEDLQEQDNDVRYISCSAIPAGRHEALESRYGAPWYELYGSTETGIDIMVEPEDHNRAVATGSIGTVVPGRELRILDPDTRETVQRGQRGVLHLRGTFMSEGYLSDSDANMKAFSAGWYATGDLGSQDEDGFVFFHGRIKDMIRRSGENVSAAQVEEVLNAHPDVDLSACIAVVDDIRGEEIKAYVVTPRAPAELLNDLIEHATQHLAYFKIPRYWEVRDQLPLTPSEKVSKPTLRAEIDRGTSFDRQTGKWGRTPPATS